jgi:predicted hydrocarbon binding protein
MASGKGAAMGASDGNIRYLRVRADTLMGLFRRLHGPVRAQALEALKASAAEHGGDSARRYFDERGRDGAALLAFMEEKSHEMGWGRWEFTWPDRSRLMLEVKDSPFAAGYGRAETEVCAPIAGMLQAVAGLALAEPCEARETACAARGAACCRFEARALTSG